MNNNLFGKTNQSINTEILPKKSVGPLGRTLYKILGVLFTLMGIIGILVPVWPTTIFLLLASSVFLKSSPRMHQWLRTNRILGPYIQAYTGKTGITIRHKLWTITLLWLTIGYSAFIAVEVLWVRIMLFGIAVAVSLHVGCIKTKIPEKKQANITTESPKSASLNESTTV